MDSNEAMQAERTRSYFRLAIWGVAIILGTISILSLVYTVPAESQGVVLRFGRYLKTVDPGLRFKLPFGVDSVMKVPVRRQLKQEFGFGTSGASNPYQASGRQEQDLERSMVTGDLLW